TSPTGITPAITSTSSTSPRIVAAQSSSMDRLRPVAGAGGSSRWSASVLLISHLVTCGSPTPELFHGKRTGIMYKYGAGGTDRHQGRLTRPPHGAPSHRSIQRPRGREAGADGAGRRRSRSPRAARRRESA